MSLPSRALVCENCSPTDCMPSPESPAKRTVALGMRSISFWVVVAGSIVVVDILPNSLYGEKTFTLGEGRWSIISSAGWGDNRSTANASKRVKLHLTPGRGSHCNDSARFDFGSFLPGFHAPSRVVVLWCGSGGRV